jgi:predicted nucleotidyltransferase
MDMRRVAQQIADGLVARFRSRIEAVMVEGSVARGDIHPHSDIDLVVFIDKASLRTSKTDLPLGESLEVGSYHVDIGYCLLDEALAELNDLYGPDWEKQSSSISDGLILYDKTGRVTEAEEANKGYDEKMRLHNAKRLWDNMLDLDEAAGTAWDLGHYRDASIYAAMYAERCLRTLFPIRGRKMSVDKRLLEHALGLVGDPDISDKILMLLRHPFRGEEERQEAAMVLNAMVEVKEWVLTQIKEAGLQQAFPDKATRVRLPGDSLEGDQAG